MADNEEALVAPEGFTIIKEGKASVLVPVGNKVFYNNVQEFNRDMSIMVLTQFHEIMKEENNAKLSLWLENKKKGPASMKDCRKRKHTTDDETIEAATPDVDNIIIPDRLQYNGLRIFEALSASGLRSIRFFKEIPEVESIHVNDLDPSAVTAIQRNVEFNKIPLDRVIPNHGDATLMMYLNRPNAPVIKTGEISVPSIFNVQRPANLKFWNAIDLDPYGSASPFLDAAVQAIENGGILNVTCTDLGVLCGNYAETCFAKYGAMSLSTHACHEMALRIVLGMIDTLAARYGRYMEPLLSFSIDFYLRVFVRVKDSPLNAKFAGTKRAIVYNCIGCRSFDIQKLGKCTNDTLPADAQIPIEKNKFTPATGPSVNKHCGSCGSVYKVGGPVWAGPLHNREFATRCSEYVKANTGKFRTHARMSGMLHQAATELPDAPFYFSPSIISNIVHTSTIKSQYIHSALFNAGYEFSETHCSAGSIKSNAPYSFVLDIFRAYVATLPDSKMPSTISLPRSKRLGAPVIVDKSMVTDDFKVDENLCIIMEDRDSETVPTPTQSSTPFDAAALFRTGKSPGHVIMAQPTSHAIDFTLRSYTEMNKKKVSVFFPNPEQFWGPKAAAGIFSNDNKHGLSSEQASQLNADNIARANAIAQNIKSRENQGKRARTQPSTTEA